MMGWVRRITISDKFVLDEYYSTFYNCLLSDRRQYSRMGALYRHGLSKALLLQLYPSKIHVHTYISDRDSYMIDIRTKLMLKFFLQDLEIWHRLGLISWQICQSLFPRAERDIFIFFRVGAEMGSVRKVMVKTTKKGGEKLPERRRGGGARGAGNPRHERME